MAISLVQDGEAHGFGIGDVAFDDPATEGNFLTMVAVIRSDDRTSFTQAGWTQVRCYYYGNWIGVYTHVVGADEDPSYSFAGISSNHTRLYIAEWSGVFAYDTSTILEVEIGATTGSVDVTPTSGVEALLLSVFTQQCGPCDPQFDADGDFTLVDMGTSVGDTGGPGPSSMVQYRTVDPTSGTYTATCVIHPAFPDDPSAGLFLAFSGEAPDPPPEPTPGVFTDGGVELTDVMHWTIQRGGSPEVTGGAQVGSATILVRNTDNQYDPENPAGILYPDFRDGLGIWIGINDDGHLAGSDPAGLFAGRVKDITLIPSPGAAEPATVEIVCEDPLGWYSRTPVNFPVSEGLSQGALRSAALTAAGETRTDLAHEITTMQLAGADGNLLAVLENINRANGTRHFIRPADNVTDWYRYTTRNRQWRLDGTVDGSIGSSDHAQVDGWRFSADTVTNQQKATTTPIRFTPATVEVWSLKQRSLRITGRHGYDAWIDFDDYVRRPIVDAQWTGNTPVIVLTPFGNRAHLKISNSSIGHSTTFGKLSIEGSIARRQPDESYVADDAVSQALPRGVRAGSDISGEFVGILESATGIALHVVWRYADVQLRPTLTVLNWFPDMFGIDLYDIISYTSTHLGVTDRLFEVVGLTHEGELASAGPVMHTTTYVLQECRVQSDPGWFHLDDSLLDGASVLAY